MAQVATQAPANLMEMMSSASPMLWDIARNQVDQQSQGNALNMAQAQQQMDFEKQKLPFELSQLGLQNDTASAQLPGVRANSNMLEDKAGISRGTLDLQKRAKLSELAKGLSENDLTEAENAVKTALVHPSAAVRAKANEMWDQLSHVKEIKLRNDALAQMGEAKNQTQLDLEKQKAAHGAYLKRWGMDTDHQITFEGNPEKRDTLIRGAISAAQQNADQDAVEKYTRYLVSNKPAYDNYQKAKVAASAGKVNAAEMTGLPGYSAPTAQVPAQATPMGEFKTPQDIKAAFQAGRISREQAKKLLQQNHGMD